MRSVVCDPPTRGRFVALYNDGSGACLFMIDEAGILLDAEEGLEQDEDLLDSFSHWFPVPDEYKFWFEGQ